MKKWIVLTAGVMLQSILGGIYAWSALVPALTEKHGFSNGQAGLVFGISIAVFTIVMVFSGKLLSKYSSRRIALAGAVLFAVGYILASASSGNFWMIFLGISVVTGAGIGTAYVCPLTVSMHWFPDNKGLVTGVAVAGFGAGAIALSFLVKLLLYDLGWNVLQVFGLVGLGLGTIAVLSSLLLSEPDHVIARKKQLCAKPQTGQFVLTKPFILLCVGMFAGTFAGLLTIANLKPILLNLGIDSRAAMLGISIFAVGNASGRVIWGQVHDKLGARRTVLMSLAFLGFSIMPLAFNLPQFLLLLSTGIIGTGFGACFVVYASSIVKYYGTTQFPGLYPICFLGYGLAGIIGPAAGGWIADVTGSFTVGMLMSILLVFIALILNVAGLAEPVPLKATGHVTDQARKSRVS